MHSTTTLIPANVMRRGYADTRAGQIHYYAAGRSGPLLFLLHETALSGSEFERVLPILGTRCRAVALDTPGYGMSDAPDAPLAIADLAACLHAAIQTFGNGPCILAGVHTGSSLALETGLLQDRVSRLIMSGLALLSAEEVAAFRSIIATPALDSEGNFLLEEWRKRRERWGEHATLADVLWGTVEQMRVYDRFNWALEAVFEHDARACLERLSCPSLFLVGEEDSLVECDRRAAPLVADARLIVLPDLGGRLPYLAPQLYADQLFSFLGLG